MGTTVQIPPIRTNLNDPNLTVQTAKEWYLYWKTSGDQINVLNRMIGHGSASDRPLPENAPDGAIWIDEDRSVLYINEKGAWHYLAGTMWATLSPDQRPTDLGANDAGFDFRTIDTAAQYRGREFIWSGTIWVETTPAQSGTHANRPAAAGMALGVFYIESDRGDVIYQIQSVSGANAWVYVAGAMTGTVIAADQRPTGLGTNDKGFLFLSTDSTSVEWDGGAWKAIGNLLDIGPAPPVSQFRIKANGLGGFSALAYSPDNIQLGFDVDLDLSGVGGWKALNATCAWISKVSGSLAVNGSAGNTAGSAAGGQITMLQINLTTGVCNFANPISVGGNRVVGPRLAAIAAPSGGTVIDVQSRAAISSIINALSAAAGGHGLIG